MSVTAEFDLLVLGGGMAGMSAAAQAALGGARVAVCETSDQVGGTARLSTGNVWTVATAEAFLAADPDGDVELWQVVRGDLAESLEWIAGLDVPVRPRHTASSSSTYDPPPIGRNVDIESFMARSVRAVTRAGGIVLYGTTVTELDSATGAVTGGRIRTLATGDEHELSAGGVVLASGGFQMNRELRARYLGDAVADAVALRSSPHCRGAGLLLALRAGAATSERMDTFYGVVLPAIPGEFTEADFRGLVLHAAVYGVVIGCDGQRLVDESAGAVAVANAIARVGRAALVVGGAMIREAQRRLGVDLAMLFRSAAHRGARSGSAPSAAAACDVLRHWGYEGATIRQTFREYDAACHGAGDMQPGRRRHRLPLGDDGLLMVEVQAATTSTLGGIRTDTHGRVLGQSGTPVRGLYAAGVDQGGYNVSGYAGGLSRALVFGRRAAAHALDADVGEGVGQ